MANSVATGVPRDLLNQNRKGRVGVTPAASIPRVNFSTGSAKALQDFAFGMFSVSDNLEDQLDEQASAEGQVEGARDGADGEFETVPYTTIRGRAYNQAGIQTFVASLETKSIVGTAEIQRRFANDPDGLKIALDQYNSGIAQELDKVSPGAGALYTQRATTRTIPAVEQARDARYAMTRDQASAAIIEQEVALNAELETHAADLFSENPARSQAAAQSLQVIGAQVMRIYDAVDPTTGKPLYSAVEKAKARAAFNEQVFSKGTLSWFNAQEDKAAAYERFSEGDFTFELNVTPAAVPIHDGTFGKIRDQPISGTVRAQMAAAAVATDPEVEILVVSGGQPGEGQGGRRTGSNRHDHGNSADIVLVKNGKTVLPGDDPELYARFLENAASAGFTGIGHYEWGIHVGGGKQAAWGPSTTSADLAPVFGEAIARGRQNPMDTVGGTEAIDMRKAMSPAAVARLDSEMRSQITFNNQQVDRKNRLEEQAHTERQEIGFTLVTDMYLNPDESGALTREVIADMLERQELSMAQTRQALSWLAEPAPDVSNEATYEELQRRMYSGEDIADDVFNSMGQLSKSDASSLLAKNQSLNSEKSATMTEEQRGYLANIRQTVAPEGLLGSLDQGASMRSFNAQDEYRKRIGEGEEPSVVAREIIERSQREQIADETFKMQRMLRPRFSVPNGSGTGVDLKASAAALDAARAAGSISDQSYRRQQDLLIEWAKAQKEITDG